MFLSFSIKSIWKNSGKTLRILAIITIAALLVLQLLARLDDVQLRDPKPREPVKEKPLRVQLEKKASQVT